MFDASHVEQLFGITNKTLQRSTLVLRERCSSYRSSIINEYRNNNKNNNNKSKVCNASLKTSTVTPFVSAVGNSSLTHLITSLHQLAEFSDYVETCNDLSTFIRHKMSEKITENINKEEEQLNSGESVFQFFKTITKALCTATLSEGETNICDNYSNNKEEKKRGKVYCKNIKTQHWSELWHPEQDETSMETLPHHNDKSNDVSAIRVSSQSSQRYINAIEQRNNTKLNTLSNMPTWDASQRQSECTGSSLTRLLCVNAFIVNAESLLPCALEKITRYYKEMEHEASLECNTENNEQENKQTVQELKSNKEIDICLSSCLCQLSEVLPYSELFRLLHNLLELLHSENILTLMLFPAIAAYASQHNMSILNSQYILGPLENVAHSLYSDYLQSEKLFAHHCYEVLCMLALYMNAIVSINCANEEKLERAMRLVQQLRNVHEVLLFALESTFHASNARPEMSRALYTHLIKPYHNVVCHFTLMQSLAPHSSQQIKSIYMTAEYRLLLIVESVGIAERHMSSGQRSLSLQQQRYAHLLTSSDGKMTINLLTTIAEDKNLLCEETTLRSPNGHRVYKIHEMEFAEDTKHTTNSDNGIHIDNINEDGQHNYSSQRSKGVSLYVYVDHGVIYFKRSNKLRQSFTPATSVDELFSCFEH